MTREEYEAERAARTKATMEEAAPLQPTPTQIENDLFRLGLLGLDEKSSAPAPHVSTAAVPRR